jgi:quinolinate synthase
MDGYIRPALDHFGPLMLLAHYYMGGEIVKLVERYGGRVADSYELALQAREHPEVKIFVESAVHFMAESIAILAHPTRRSGSRTPRPAARWRCWPRRTWSLPLFDELHERYGDDLSSSPT